MANAPKKKYSELTPAYKKRLEAAYKSGKFGEGYSSAGRAYAAGASRQVARGQAKTSEAVRTKRRTQTAKAKEWSKKHSRNKQTDFSPPAGLTPDDLATYTESYVKATKELEKGWSRGKTKNRKQVNWDIVKSFFDDYDIAGYDDYFSIV